MEEFISSGKWWLPSQPQITVPGKLSELPQELGIDEEKEG
jgi:hypothetical protein